LPNISRLKNKIIKKLGFNPNNVDECFNAVKKTPGSIQYIKNPTERVQLEAVKHSGGYLIQYIHNPSEEVQLLSVKLNGNAISYIKNPFEEVQLAAVEQDPYSIRFIKSPSIEVQKAAIYYSRYNLLVIALCPDWEDFEKEIEDNMMIKDIIE
jgi:hypothetical protein